MIPEIYSYYSVLKKDSSENTCSYIMINYLYNIIQ